MKFIVKIVIFLGIIGVPPSLFGNNQTSQTIFVPRSIITDSTFDNSLQWYRYCLGGREFHRKQHSQTPSYISASALYMSSESGDELARYFFPNNKNVLTVAEDGTGDIGSPWIGLVAPLKPLYGVNPTFFDQLSIDPKRVVYGSLIHVHGNVTNNFFVEAKIPIISVRHELKLKHVVGGKANTLDFSDDRLRPTLVDAFNYSGWRYGKLSTVALTKHGIDDVLFRIGYNFLSRETIFAKIYGDFVAPTGERPSAEYLFEPLVGSKHFAVGGGISFDASLYKGNACNLSLSGDARYHFRCSAPELRMLDLKKNGNWSRYIQLAPQSDPSHPLDGINILTRDVDVHPGSSFEALTSLHYQHTYFKCELGFNFWYRGREQLEMNDHWNQDEQAKGIYYPAGSRPTASTALISQNLYETTPDANFILTKESDFDLDSASHKEAMSYKIFGGISSNYMAFNFPASVGAGYSYEFGRSNTALNQWGVWLSSYIQF